MTTDPFTETAHAAAREYARTPRMNVGTVQDRIGEAHADGWEAARTHLAALGAEPDETDYAEVVEENNRLGRKLSAALRERDAARSERDAARVRIQELLPDRDSWKDRAEEAQEALRAAENATEGPREDQDQLDRSWALEKAGEVLGRLAAVGVDARTCGVSLLPLAEWILGGEQVDRG